MEDLAWLNWQRTLHPRAEKDCVIFSNAQEEFTKVDYFLGHKTSLSEFPKSKSFRGYSLAAIVLNQKSVMIKVPIELSVVVEMFCTWIDNDSHCLCATIGHVKFG